MLLTTKVHINEKDSRCNILRNLTYHSARMYNVGLYSVRQHFFKTKQYLPYKDNYHLCKINENYHLLLTDSSQQVLRVVDRDMKSFFKLIKLKEQGQYDKELIK